MPPCRSPEKTSKKTDNNNLMEGSILNEKDNYLNTAELSGEQNTNMLDGILNNAPLAPPVPVPEEKPLDKVKEQPPRKRSREREDR